jgi:hypothetical protein
MGDVTLFVCGTGDVPLDALGWGDEQDDPNACRHCGEWMWLEGDGEDDDAAYQQHCAHCGREIYGGGDG